MGVRNSKKTCVFFAHIQKAMCKRCILPRLKMYIIKKGKEGINFINKLCYFLISNLKYFIATRLRAWYSLWFILTSYYLYNNWSEAMTFSPFNGNSLIFCVWIAMIIKPFIKEIDTPWIKAKMRETKEEQQENKENFDIKFKKTIEEQRETKEKFDKIITKELKQKEGGNK